MCVCVCSVAEDIAHAFAVQRDARPLFDMLLSKYGPALERDPAFKEYIQSIGAPPVARARLHVPADALPVSRMQATASMASLYRKAAWRP